MKHAIQALGNAILNFFGGVCPECKRFKMFWDFDKRNWRVCDFCLNMRLEESKQKKAFKNYMEEARKKEMQSIENTQHGLRGGK